MKYPAGAIKSLEEMMNCLDNPVYVVLPPGFGGDAPRPHPQIVKIIPIRVDNSYPRGVMVFTREQVSAAELCGIATEINMTVQWGNRSTKYYFPNFWHAYAHYLKSGVS